MTSEALPKSPWTRPSIIELTSGENPFSLFPREQSDHFDLIRSKAAMTSFRVLADPRRDPSRTKNTPSDDSQ
ncbi:hypothetical protein NBRC106471_2655 [Acetobacter pasteurianus subsp. pasteurianus LMG 1262 = NBRC 106471]|nr:hypothetical protein NBRC106471_2655 [Acetobacter pasteurianus subsp. pasteurianus LMG 1262 = NBRC 106471]